MTESAILIATAGHVDHGKSTLVKALTGTDPDRLAEEKRRGITIDLGYAHTEIAGRTYSFVDVPGHERFIHNMLAGIGAIDAVLFVIAADASIMPQTREHARALAWLGVEQICVILTKVDLVDAELLELLDEEVADWLSDFGWSQAPRVRFSAKRPETLADVTRELTRLHKRSTRPSDTFRLSIDRVFTRAGSGTVVTGTVERGNLSIEDAVLIQPGATPSRIRQLQVHSAPATALGPHTRGALNLSDIHYRELARGDQVFGRIAPEPTRRLLVRLSSFETEWHPGPRHTLHLHHLAAHLMARVTWRHDDFAMLTLERPCCFWALDRGLLRDGSPLQVIAGFEVLDPRPLRARYRHWRDALTAAPPAADLEAWQAWFVDHSDGILAVDAVLSRCGEALAEHLRPRLIQLDTRSMIRAELWNQRREALILGLKELHRRHPLYAFIARSEVVSYFRELGWPTSLLQKLLGAAANEGLAEQAGDRLRYTKHRVLWKDEDLKLLRELLQQLEQPPAMIDFRGEKERRQRLAGLVDLLLWERYVVPLASDILVEYSFLNHIAATLHQRYEGRLFSIQELKEEFGLSRKYAIPLLEYLDRIGCTRREDEGRVWIARTPPVVQGAAFALPANVR